MIILYLISIYYYIILDWMLSFILIFKFSVAVNIINIKISHNQKSKCEWMIKHLNQIFISLIFHSTFVQTLFDHIISHRLPIYSLFNLNISNNIYYIYIILKETSFEAIIVFWNKHNKFTKMRILFQTSVSFQRVRLQSESVRTVLSNLLYTLSFIEALIDPLIFACDTNVSILLRI